MADVKPLRTEGPTPRGGAYALAYFKNASGAPCEKADAVEVEIHECDAAGRVIGRTYGKLGAGRRPKG